MKNALVNKILQLHDVNDEVPYTGISRYIVLLLIRSLLNTRMTHTVKMAF